MTRILKPENRVAFRVAVEKRVLLGRNPDFDHRDPESAPQLYSDETFVVYFGLYQLASVARGVLRQEYGRESEYWDKRRERNGLANGWIERCPLVGWEVL